MALALIVLEGLSVVAIVVASVAGLVAAHALLPVAVSPRTHVVLALSGAIVILFAHSMTMFYFIGTGVRMKELVAEHRVREDLITPTRRFKARVFPWATMALLVTMVTFIVGGGVDTGKLPGWIHLILALGACVLNYVTALRAVLAIHANVRLFDHLDDLVVQARQAGGAPQGERST
jgi:hypothetical protein